MDDFIKDEKSKILAEIAKIKDEVKEKAKKYEETDKKGNQTTTYLLTDPKVKEELL